jgi:hypothetical protein
MCEVERTVDKFPSKRGQGKNSIKIYKLWRLYKFGKNNVYPLEDDFNFH